MRTVTALVTSLVALATVTACSSKRAGGGAVTVDGSSTVFLISAAVAESVKKDLGIDATIGSSGTGGGMKKLCAGEVDVAGASRPIKPAEADACKGKGIEFIELPVAYDGIAVVVNLKNTFVDKLTVDELKAIWSPEAEGKVTSWSQVRAGWPDQPLRLLGAGADSGTYDYFTAAVVGKEHSSRGDYRQSEDDNVLVQGVESDANALAFFGFAYYAENKGKLKIIPIDNGKAEDGDGGIVPSLETIAGGSYQPLSRPIFIYVNKASLAKGNVKKFVDYYLANATKLSAKVGYVPLPAPVDALVKKRLADGKTGSAWSGGSKIGVTLEQLLAAEGGA